MFGAGQFQTVSLTQQFAWKLPFALQSDATPWRATTD